MAQPCNQDQTYWNNLIENPGFEQNCEPGVGFYAFPSCLINWQTAQGTPHLFTTPFAEPLPTDAGLFNLCIAARRLAPGPNECYRESIFQPINIFDGQLYNLSFQTKTRSVTIPIPGQVLTFSAPIDFTVSFANNIISNVQGEDCSTNPITGARQTILAFDEFNQQDWTVATQCSLESNNNYDNIIFSASNDQVGESSAVFVDNVQLWCESQLNLSFSHAHQSWNNYSFTATTQGNSTAVPTSWQWNFGDGTTSNIQNPNHGFIQPGNYVVWLGMTDNRGCTRRVEQTITVYDEANCNCPNNSGNFNIGQNGQTTVLSNSAIGQNNYIINTGKCISVKGNLEIDKNFLFQGGEIRMHPGASITLPSNGNYKLSFYETSPATIDIHGCGIMWLGTNVNNNQLSVKNAIIHDAENAISCSNNSKLRIESSTFTNNWVGLRLASSNFLLGSMEAFISATTFQGFGTMNAAYTPGLSSNLPINKPYTGILVFGMHSLNLKGVNGAFQGLAHPFNNYLNMDNGIVAYFSDIDVDHSIFQIFYNVPQNTIRPSGNGIFSSSLATEKGSNNLDLGNLYPCQFFNCNNAVRSHRSKVEAGCGNIDNCNFGFNITDPVMKIMRVENCSLDNIKSTGIRVHNNSGIPAPIGYSWIRYNQIKIKGGGSYPPTDRGLDLNVPAIGLEINDNTIEMLPNTIGQAIYAINSSGLKIYSNMAKLNSQLTSGIMSKNSNSNLYACNMVLGSSTNSALSIWHNAYTFTNNSNSVISCNSSDKTSQGFYFDGLNDLANHFSKNTMFSHYKALSYKDLNSTTGEQDYTSNQWDNSTGGSSYQAFHGGLLTGAQKSLYKVPSLSGFNPSPVVPSSGWFQSQGTQTSSCAGLNCQTSPLLPEFGRLDSFVIAQSFTGEGYFPASQYITEKMLMYKLFKNPELLAEPNAQTFYNSRLNVNAGKVSRVKYIFDHANTPDSNLIANLVQLNSQIDLVSDTVAMLNDMIVDTSGAVADYYRTIRSASLNTKRTIILQCISIEQTLDSLSELRLQTARNILSSITPDNTWERNDKYVWNVQLNRNTQAIVNGLKDTLTNIANQCWGYGGDAVFIARAKIDTFSFSFDTCSAPINSRWSNNIEQFTDIQLYPNPANNTLIIEGIDIIGSDVLIKQVHGVMIKSFKNVKSNNLILDISEMPNGFYFIAIQRNGTSTSIIKFIKQ